MPLRFTNIVATMKKRDNSAAIIIGLALLGVFLIIQMCYFSNSLLNNRLNVSIHSNKSYQESKNLIEKEISTWDPQDHVKPIVCDRTHDSYDICEVNGPTVLDPTEATFYTTDPTGHKRVDKIRPYPRKLENSTMSRIKELTLVSGPVGPEGPLGPQCEVQHQGPALVFSAGGYTGNFFHEFSDGFIPLYITVHSMFDEDQRRDLVLVISKSRDWWLHKYSDLLRSFTRHAIVNLDNDTATHCFPSAKLGLVSHGFMAINPSETLTLARFRAFLGESYGWRSDPETSLTRPRLVLVSRTGRVGRVLTNELEVKREAERVGFEVVMFEPSEKTALSSAYELVNSSHAMVGVHGAALTHALFLRPGSMFVQVVPLGVEWLAEVCFGNAARDMGLEYAEYRIAAHESSLVDKYGSEHMVIKDPTGFRGKEWSNMNVYLKEQNVKIDMGRFRSYLKIAYRKSKKFMKRKG